MSHDKVGAKWQHAKKNFRAPKSMVSSSWSHPGSFSWSHPESSVSHPLSYWSHPCVILCHPGVIMSHPESSWSHPGVILNLTNRQTALLKLMGKLYWSKKYILTKLEISWTYFRSFLKTKYLPESFDVTSPFIKK